MLAALLLVLRRHPSAILLAGQLAGVLIYPVLESSDVGRSLFSVFGIAILGLVVLTARSTRGFTGVAIVLGVPATVLLLIQAITQDDSLLAWSSGLEALLYFYTAGALVAYMLEDHVITRDELFAVGATFTLVAWGFAYVFTVYQEIEPGGFTTGADPRTWMELLFLSFTTISSVGLSDVVPVTPFARSLLMIEQIAGVGYVAILVSRVVGLTVLHGAARRG
ncbi:MAG TPA: potassium channel family protein [Thermoleophilaceae bacterium]|nr:potassium channel family protein [Thermoleophilaceae bacterium]